MFIGMNGWYFKFVKIEKNHTRNLNKVTNKKQCFGKNEGYGQVLTAYIPSSPSPPPTPQPHGILSTVCNRKCQ